MDGSNKFIVQLSAEARERLESITRNGSAPAKKILHARVLLMSDQHHASGRYHDHQIAAALGIHVNTVARIRKLFVQHGEQPAVDRKPRLTPPVPPKIDGKTEAMLVAVCCSKPPDGQTRMDAFSSCRSTGRPQDCHQHLPRDHPQDAQKNTLQPWRKQRFCIPERDSARFVAQMEQVLDLYAKPQDDDEPLINMDEASKELHAHVSAPLPISPGKPQREDDKYERHGTRAIFMFFAPLLGWRRATSREHRTRIDWAQEIKRLLDEDFPMPERFISSATILTRTTSPHSTKPFPPKKRIDSLDD